MSRRVCEREEAVVHAILEGGFEGALESHVSGCAECREAARVTLWMRDVAAAAREAAAEGLPEAAEIWWRAEVRGRVDRRRTLVQRAVEPIAVFERWAGLAAAVALAAIGWLQAGRISAWIADRGLTDLVADPGVVTASGLVAASSLALSAVWLVERLRRA